MTTHNQLKVEQEAVALHSDLAPVRGRLDAVEAHVWWTRPDCARQRKARPLAPHAGSVASSLGRGRTEERRNDADEDNDDEDDRAAADTPAGAAFAAAGERARVLVRPPHPEAFLLWNLTLGRHLRVRDAVSLRNTRGPSRAAPLSPRSTDLRGDAPSRDRVRTLLVPAIVPRAVRGRVALRAAVAAADGLCLARSLRGEERWQRLCVRSCC